MDKLFNSIYKGKNVFITGHTGFKGGWLAYWLYLLGANVSGYSLSPDTEPNFFTATKLANKITSTIGDICNFENLLSAMQKAKPDIVFHLAAQPLVRLSYNEPENTYKTNVMGTLNVFEACRKTDSVKAIVNITTDKCYENVEKNYFYKEEDKLGGYDPYSSSKACAEILSSSYRRSFFEPKGILLATARAGNVIGGGDWAQDRLVPDCIRSLVKNEKIKLRYPNATRPWQFVLEPLRGYLQLGQKLLEGKAQFAQAFNFGPDNNSVLKVIEVVNHIVSAWGFGEIEIDQANNPHEANLLMLDINKAKEELGFVPVFSPVEAIDKTVIWYRAFYENSINMSEFSQRQLMDFSLKIADQNVFV